MHYDFVSQKLVHFNIKLQSCVYLFSSLENVSQNSGGRPNVVGVFDKSCPKQRVSHADFLSGVYVTAL